MAEQRKAIAKPEVLKSKVAIAKALEDSTEAERKGYHAAAEKKVAHLHRITEKPSPQNGEPEPLAGARPLVGNYLRDREERLDAQPGKPYSLNVRF